MDPVREQPEPVWVDHGDRGNDAEHDADEPQAYSQRGRRMTQASQQDGDEDDAKDAGGRLATRRPSATERKAAAKRTKASAQGAGNSAVLSAGAGQGRGSKMVTVCRLIC